MPPSQNDSFLLLFRNMDHLLRDTIRYCRKHWKRFPDIFNWKQSAETQENNGRRKKSVALVLLVILVITLLQNTFNHRHVLVEPIFEENELRSTSKDIFAKMHGMIGCDAPNAEIVCNGEEKPLSTGLSTALPYTDLLPLDRYAPDKRKSLCLKIEYNYTRLAEYKATILINFYNEGFSTLLRTVHSILNRTPPELLDSIILIDDGSTNLYASEADKLKRYLTLLPKTRMIRQRVNTGIVSARLTGARLVKTPVFIVLDSHIEVNVGWIEPLLHRLSESPKSLVFPTSRSIDGGDGSYLDSGIGPFLTFRWFVSDHAKKRVNANAIHTTSPVSPGGLFAIMTEWFWELGGYDEGMDGWGAENVEQAFRIWMCGGQVECAHCSMVHHVSKSSKPGDRDMQKVWRNRLRTASIWMDEWSVLPYLLSPFNAAVEYDSYIGSVAKVKELRKRLHCESFGWYLKNVADTPKHSDLSTVDSISQFENKQNDGFCLDATFEKPPRLRLMKCSKGRVSQLFILSINEDGLYSLESGRHVEHCISSKAIFRKCIHVEREGGFTIQNNDMLQWKSKGVKAAVKEAVMGRECLATKERYPDGKLYIVLEKCDESKQSQHWKWVTIKEKKNMSRGIDEIVAPDN